MLINFGPVGQSCWCEIHIRIRVCVRVKCCDFLCHRCTIVRLLLVTFWHSPIWIAASHFFVFFYIYFIFFAIQIVMTLIESIVKFYLNVFREFFICVANTSRFCRQINSKNMIEDEKTKTRNNHNTDRE